MKRWIVLFMLIGVSGCGNQPGKLVEVTGMASLTTPFPTIEPVRKNGVVVIDGLEHHYANPMVVTTDETVVLMLSRFRSRFPQETYGVVYDSNEWVRFDQGQPVATSGGPELYPEEGWILKPIKPGIITTVTFFIHNDDPNRCTSCEWEQLHGHTYVFQVERAP